MKKKNSIVIIIICAMVMLLTLALVFYKGVRKAAVIKVPVKTAAIKVAENAAPSAINVKTTALPEAKGEPGQPAEEKLAADEKGAAVLQERQGKAQVEEAAVKEQRQRLTAKPEKIEIEVEEGQRATSQFTITNEGTAAVHVNIYKSEEGILESDAQAKAGALLNHKKAALGGASAASGTLSKASLFSGIPWLMQFPYYASIEPGESKAIQVKADASSINAGEYKACLTVLGSVKGELLIVPVFIKVIEAPKIKLVKISVDDGFSPDTTGDKNNVANPGEKVAITLYLQNIGSAQAKDLTMELNTENSPVRILDNSFVSIGDVAARGQFSGRFLVEVDQAAHPQIPPSASVRIRSADAKAWSENFYIGENGKFPYPLGAKVDEKDGADNVKETPR